MNTQNDKAPVTQAVARQLQEMIRNGVLRPDERIPSQRVLSERFGVSRASLREALLTLETLGLVRTYPARGTFVVASGTPRDGAPDPWRFGAQYSMLEVFQSRLMIEPELCRLAAPHVTAALGESLQQATSTFERAWKDGDLVGHVEADLSFHAGIAQACPNQMLKDLYQSIRDLLTESQRVPIPNTALVRMQASIAEHRAILEALRRNDPTAAQDRMAAHIRNTAACAGIRV